MDLDLHRLGVMGAATGIAIALGFACSGCFCAPGGAAHLGNAAGHFVEVVRSAWLPRGRLFPRYGGEEFVLALAAAAAQVRSLA